MGNVNFDFDKATITADSQFVLDEIANTLARFTDTMFLVAGYTDAKGSDEYNEELSRARAKAVYEALLQGESSHPDFVTRDLANVSPLCQSRPRMSSAGVTARSFSKG